MACSSYVQIFIRDYSCSLIVCTIFFQRKTSNLVNRTILAQNIKITILVITENIGRLHGVFKKLIRSGKCFRSVCAYPIVHGGKNHGRALLLPQQYLCIGELVFRFFLVPCCTRVAERQTIGFAVKCSNSVFIALDMPVFVYIADIYAVISNVDIFFVIADKTDGIGEILYVKGDGVCG